MHDRLSRHRPLLWIVAGALLVRILYVLFFVDGGRDYYWEYGEIAKNLLAGKGYALHHLDHGAISARFDPAASPVPSAYMPPGYVAFLYPFLAIGTVPVRNAFLLGAQIVISAGAVIAVFLFARRVFGSGAALPAAALAAFLPEFIYAVGSYTPTVLYHLLVVGLLGILYAQSRTPSVPLLLAGALIGALLVYLRSETALFVLLCPVLIARTRGWRAAGLFLAAVLVLYTPWVVRNTVVLDRFVPFTTSGGLNFFRGHNAEGHGAWEDSTLAAQRAGIPMDRNYEATLDRLYWNQALEHVRHEPGSEIGLAAGKIRNLWWLNPDEPRSTSWLYVVPWVGVLGLSAAGWYSARPLRNHLPSLIFLGVSTLVSVAFFVLPRYQTMMKIALLPFVGLGYVSLTAWVKDRAGRTGKGSGSPGA